MKALPMLGAAALLAASAMSAEAAGPWTGCYGGAALGVTAVTIDEAPLGADGYSVGGFVGCDVQIERFVAGLFADYSWKTLDTAGLTFDATQYSLGGRAGFTAVGNNALIYALGAWTHLDGDFGVDLDGLAVGGGVELFVANHVTAGLEYRYTMYDAIMGIDPSEHSVVARVAYHFGGIKPLDDLAK